MITDYRTAELGPDEAQKLILPLNKKENIDFIIIPGLVDVHVHLREPGFSYKETVFSGSRAAARGGFTAVCAMPNLNPVPDCAENLQKELDIIKRDALISVLPYGAVTVCESGERLADMERMAPYVCAFSDDGKGVQNDSVMREAMLKAVELDKIIASHCEDNSLLCGGYVHAGEYAARHGHRGIVSACEYRQLERDIALAAETGCRYHVCHISTKESVELIRCAKADGVDITCETAPHYLILNDSMLKDEGRFKMNPPIRSEDDRLALIEGIKDGTIDMIATDHAPHSAAEKSSGLKDSLMGISGLECAFPVLYTRLVETGIISPEKLLQLMSGNPGRRFGIDNSGDFSVFAVGGDYKIEAARFLSQGKSTPFDGERVSAKCILTVHRGSVVWQDNKAL